MALLTGAIQCARFSTGICIKWPLIFVIYLVYFARKKHVNQTFCKAILRCQSNPLKIAGKSPQKYMMVPISFIYDQILYVHCTEPTYISDSCLSAVTSWPSSKFSSGRVWDVKEYYTT